MTLSPMGESHVTGLVIPGQGQLEAFIGGRREGGVSVVMGGGMVAQGILAGMVGNSLGTDESWS